ncbi:hypothetical protein SAMN05216359_105265 [Roseateles sp. YR242]|uniref:hypothetical protein n=1 Tax=Roseateles sp. YR242 TaxID=1855305 RepID=UPI0008B6EB87|nr:hypothetical protein [Roseateles sp. YR242]SEL11922.1 hypothetical protein SAMN05216359_105265 [Roseateles sp. YR242]
MAALPSYVGVTLANTSEDFDPEVISTQMERGLDKTRLGNTRVVMKVTVGLLFKSRADTVAFDDWYFNTIGRIGWFDWFDSRYQVTRSVRFEGGKLGALTPLAGRFEVASRTAVLEFLR